MRKVNKPSDETLSLIEQSFAVVDGNVIWNTTRSNRAVKGNLFGAVIEGYRRGKVNKHNCHAHQIAYFLHNGVWPDKIVDHIDGDRSNNRKENLRLATQFENARNSISRVNSCGYKGVFKSKQKLKKPYTSEITVFNKRIYLGYFETAEEAHEAYKQAAIKYHGEFARW